MPNPTESAILNLLRNIDKSNPAVYRGLELLIRDVYTMYSSLFPPQGSGGQDQETAGGTLGEITNLVIESFSTNLRLRWDDIPGAFRYEIRLGSNWATATPLVRTGSNVVNFDPEALNLIYGTYTFQIRPVNIAGAYGPFITTGTFTVNVILPPELQAEVINNNVLLSWTPPTSQWKLDYYIIYTNGVERGRSSGTFQILQELAGGVYEYSVAAVDIVGNVSLLSAVRSVTLQNPSDFEFVDSLFADYTGIFFNTKKAVVDGKQGVVGVIVTETWEEHYLDNSWLTPQDQIDAGFPKYYQPAGINGYYEEVFDFGQILTDLTITTDYTKVQLNGTTNISVHMSYSEDDITYTTPVVGTSIFGTSFRYVKVRYIFTNVDVYSLAFLFDLQVVLNVSLSLDSGEVSAIATDVAGTLVEYNKVFSQVNSVTTTPVISVQPLYIVVDAVTADDFRVLVYDSSGNRINADIAWKARGILFN